MADEEPDSEGDGGEAGADAALASDVESPEPPDDPAGVDSDVEGGDQ